MEGEESLDLDQTTEEGAANINDPISEEEWDSLIPRGKETKNSWWDRVGNRFKKFNKRLKDTLWNGRDRWNEQRTEYIQLHNLYEYEDENEEAIETIKNRYPDADTEKFITGVNEYGQITVKLARKIGKNKPRTYVLGDPKTNKTLKEYLGKSAYEKNVDNLEEINKNDQANEQDRAILEDQNSSDADKEAARSRIDDREAQNESLEQENEELEERLTLKEKVKCIFKKYGVTVVGVALAASAVIVAIVEALSKRLAQVASGVKNGLKAIGKKLAEILPSALGAIVSFLFKSAGEVVSFIGRNAWLLIVAVVIFLIERVKKSSK